MKRLSGKEKCVCAAAAAALIAAIGYSFERTVIHGVLAWESVQPEYVRMIVEVLILFCLYALIGRLAPRRWLRIAGMCAVSIIFLWLHVVLLPILVSGLYLIYVCMAGRQIRGMAGGLGSRRAETESAARYREYHQEWEEENAAGYQEYRQTEEGNPSARRGRRRVSEVQDDPGRDFLIGSLGVICLFCLMSAAGIGSIPQMCGAVGVTAVLLLLAEHHRGEAIYPLRIAERAITADDEGRWSTTRALGTALVLTVFCIQAGRMNIAVDYDTIWYGARSPYILNNGHGIYENLGTVSVVYTYSKGWETLTLPLSILPSYSFLTSASWWLAAGIICAAYEIAGYFMNRRMAAMFAVFLSTIPAVMNMSLSAKTDIATLLVQMLMIREILRILVPEEGSRRNPAEPPAAGGVSAAYGSMAAGGSPAAYGSPTAYGSPAAGESPAAYEPPAACGASAGGTGLALAYSAAAFLLSWTFKPTALVFSTAVYGMSMLYLLFTRKLSFRCPRKNIPEAAVTVILAVCGLAAIWARTWLLTGLPVTSVFSSVFIKLGFQMKYPYRAKPVPNSGDSMGFMEKLSHLADRLYGFLLNPDASADMSHVIITWGGPALWFVILAAAAWLLLRRAKRSRRERRLDGWLAAVCIPFLAVNLISLYLLEVLDGNYFMLLYVLLALAGFRLLARLRGVKARKVFLGLAVPVMLFSVMFMTLTDWAWSLGFTPVDLDNNGYYDHQKANYERMSGEGKGAIWEMLARNPRSRLIILGNHPQDLAFPCSAQSFVDIAGSDGNGKLIKHMADFVEFMEYAKTDYLFLDSGWVDDDEGLWEFVYYLIEYGHLVPVHYEGDYMLAQVHTDGQYTEESEARSVMFLNWEKERLEG